MMKKPHHLFKTLTAISTALVATQAFGQTAAAPVVAAAPVSNEVVKVSTYKGSKADKACTPSEKWTFSDEISGEWREEWSKFLSGSSSPVRGFSEALGLRRQFASGEPKFFAEYWISRALLQGKLHHIAYAGFTKIASYDPKEIGAEAHGIQTAAIDCLNRIYELYPSFSVSKAVQGNLKTLISNPDTRKEPLWEFAQNAVRVQLAEGAPKSQVMETMALLKGAGAYESFAQGLYSARHSSHKAAIKELNSFLNNPAIPAVLSKFTDHARLLLARSLYTVGKYNEAGLELQKMKKSSNELATALSELSWAFLMDEKLREAIGTAMNLQAGGLRHTFAPEAPMVMAMALNELCQYPESIRAIDQFKKHYEKPYRWLAKWKSEQTDVYPMAVKFLKKELKVPDRVGTEWVRSPIFISHQDEINLIFKEKTASESLGKSGSAEQKQLGASIKAMAAALKPKIKTARASLKPGQMLPKSIINDLVKLKEQMAHYRRVRTAAAPWHTILGNHNKNLPGLQKGLVTRMNKHLADKNIKMLSQIEEIAENNQLIEIEIYNGASQDIIWQNAHPEYKKMAQQMNTDRKENSAEKVWDWGRAPAQIDDDEGDKVEVWEDELGSFKANLYDNCSSKEKYLAIKRRR